MIQPQPQLIHAKLEKLHPTQITVGKREVELKRKRWGAMGKKARIAALGSHWFPAVHGPGDRYYIVDHHHFGLALLEEEVKTVSLMLLKDLSWLELPRFWNVMDHHQWAHPYDSQGKRCGFDAIPGRLTAMHDDPYRSLAGEVRQAGGFSKDVTPFSEFLWADFFRSRINRKLIDGDFPDALRRANKLAGTQEARYLPGWCGAIDSA
jgi:hypothetical protein